MNPLVLAIILFIAFTIGLNLGLHGVIVVTHRTDHEPTEETNPTGIPNVKSTVTPQDQHQQQLPSTSISATEKPKPEPAVDPFKIVQEKLTDLEKRVSSQMTLTKPISNKFQDTPIVLLTCCRPELLKVTLESLFQARGVDKSKVIIVQDGTMAEVKAIASDKGLKVIQNPNTRLRGDGGSRIAQHYKFALTSAFDHFTNANALVIIEDDLLFSPDFYEYLTNVGSVLYEDPTTFIVSAWNDNGFRGKVYNPYALRRTDFFPGLGWLLTRKLYKTELESRWPNEHWDHWLRSPEIHQHREIIYPQVPRTYHNGVKGTFMDVSTHNKYFRDIDYNKDTSISWVEPSSSSSSNNVAFYQQVTYEYNENRIIELIHSCKHLQSVHELVQFSHEIICIWVQIPIYDVQNPPFQKVSDFFGLWHEHKRGNHKGLHEFYFYSNYILLLNVDQSAASPLPNKYQSDKYRHKNYEQFKPTEARLLNREEFQQNELTEVKKKFSLEIGMKSHKPNIFTAMKTDQSCDEVLFSSFYVLRKVNFISCYCFFRSVR
jgi:hypothetical protein